MLIKHSNIAHEKIRITKSVARWCHDDVIIIKIIHYLIIMHLLLCSFSRLVYYQNLQQSTKRISKMISKITRSRDERGPSNTQYHGVSDPLPVIPRKEIKSAVLLQVVKQIKIEMKKAYEQSKAIWGIKLHVMKEFNIPWLNWNILDYYLMKADEWEEQQAMSVVREEATETRKEWRWWRFCVCVVAAFVCELWHFVQMNYSDFFWVLTSAPLSNSR